MKPILFAACMSLIACSSVKKANLAPVQQGITGFITEVTGNRMPMVGTSLPAPKGVIRTVFVYEPTNIAQVTRSENSSLYTAIATRQVASVQTDSTGAFALALAPGTYSVFIKQGTQFYANLFNARNDIAIFTVEAGKLTVVNLTVNSSAVY